MSNLNKTTIPKGWEEVKLGDISTIKNGKSNSQDAVDNGEYVFFDRSTLIKKSNKFLFDSESVILPGEGKEFIPRYYTGKFDLHQRAYSITPDKNVHCRFLYYYLLKNKKLFLIKSVGSTVKSLRLPMIKSTPVILPTPSEQDKIAEILSRIDEDIEKTDQVIEKTEKLKKGLMQELLIKGIGHKKFKKTKLGKIPEKWEVKDLIDVATLQRGFDLPIQNRIRGEYPMATSNGITDYHNEYKVLGPGVFTGRSGTIGNVFYIEKNYWPHNTTLYVKDFHGNNEKFIYYFLHQFNLKNFYSGTGVPTLNRNIVHKEKVAIPKSKKEQNHIAEILSSVDNKIDINKQIKTKLALLKKGLMQDLLGGRVRVDY